MGVALLGGMTGGPKREEMSVTMARTTGAMAGKSENKELNDKINLKKR